MKKPDHHRRNKGVALITAMLVTAVAAVAAASMAARQHIDVRRSSNIFDVGQAYLFTQGVEAWALKILERDRRDSRTDYDGEDWATVLPPIAVEGGVVAGVITDQQGRFNINNLVVDGEASGEDIKRFERLLDVLDCDVQLAQAVVDWLDADESVTFPGGAEDNVYLGYDTPYRTANRLMVSPSELMLIHGMTAEQYELLRPYVTTLPERTALNINTAEAAVLRAMFDGLTESDAERLISDRGDEGFSSIDSLKKHPLIKDRWPGQQTAKAQQGGQQQANSAAVFSVSSDYFMIAAVADFGRAEQQLYSLVKRQQSGATVIMRAQGDW